jgi:hypothetical protein
MDLFDALLGSIWRDALNPLVFVPAFALGWFARRNWLLLAGALVIAAVQTILSLLEPLPAGAGRWLWAEPLGVVAPFLLAFAALRLRRWLRASDRADPRSTLPCLVHTALGAIIGAGIGTGLFLGIGLAIVTLGDIHDREGGEAYLLVFVVAPFGLLLGLGAGARLAWRRSGAARPVPAIGGRRQAR